jgi:hypothetical protein
MPNGIAALHALVEPAPVVAPSKDAPAGAAATAIETAIGQATVDAAITCAWAMLGCHQTGKLSPAAKEAGGAKIAAMAMLQLGHERGDADFVATARAAAMPLLRSYLDTTFFQRYGAAQGDAVIGQLVDEVLGIVGKVVRDERMFAN